MAQTDGAGRSTREVNTAIRKLIAQGSADITVLNPGARHNLAVAILDEVRIRVAGSAGYYCGGLGDGASIEVEGSAGWGLAESMLSGTIRVHGNAGSGAEPLGLGLARGPWRSSRDMFNGA
jgi:methylamine---glutamate N-methyltransferase subunit B